MRVTLVKTADQVRALRRERYLAAWPLHAQAEAHADAAAGKPDKLNRMLAEMAEIKAALPLPQATLDPDGGI